MSKFCVSTVCLLGLLSGSVLAQEADTDNVPTSNDVTSTQSSDTSSDSIEQLEDIVAESGDIILGLIYDSVSPDSTGEEIDAATANVLNDVTSEESTLLTEGDKGVITSNMELAQQLFSIIASGSTIGDAITAIVTLSPESASNLIVVASSLFPSSGTEIVQASVDSGLLSLEDAQALVLASGGFIDEVDPALETAAGGGLGGATAPLGEGVGSAGSGGGDTSASTN